MPAMSGLCKDKSKAALRSRPNPIVLGIALSIFLGTGGGYTSGKNASFHMLFMWQLAFHGVT